MRTTVIVLSCLLLASCDGHRAPPAAGIEFEKWCAGVGGTAYADDIDSKTYIKCIKSFPDNS